MIVEQSIKAGDLMEQTSKTKLKERPNEPLRIRRVAVFTSLAPQPRTA